MVASKPQSGNATDDDTPDVAGMVDLEPPAGTGRTPPTRPHSPPTSPTHPTPPHPPRAARMLRPRTAT